MGRMGRLSGSQHFGIVVLSMGDAMSSARADALGRRASFINGRTDMSGNNQWRDGFVHKLDGLRSRWVGDFKSRVSSEVVPAFDEISSFVAEHGFRASSPVVQPDRQSFKFEMAENAFVLLTLSHESIGDVLLRCEYFAPGAQPGEHGAVLGDERHGPDPILCCGRIVGAICWEWVW